MRTDELLLEWDRRRPRSKQVEIGMSDLGVCRRRAGYTLANTPHSNPGSAIRAVMGTVLHDGVAEVCRQLQDEGLLPDGWLIEHTVSFAGVLGHLDRYESDSQTLVDVKSTGHRWLEHVKVYGPPRHDLWQSNLYTAALVTNGHPVAIIAIDYLCRDCGELYRWSDAPDPEYVRAALNWLKEVRETDLEWLPRDYEPHTAFCRECPFLATCWSGREDRDPRTVLYDANPNGVEWARKLTAARKDLAEAKVRANEAKGALDALRPNDLGTAELDIGFEYLLRWTVSTVRRLDSIAVKRDYAKAGGRAPTNETQTVKLDFAAREPGLREDNDEA